MDVLIGHAVRLAWLEKNPHRISRYDEDKAKAWQAFYATSPRECTASIVDAFKFLTRFE